MISCNGLYYGFLYQLRVHRKNTLHLCMCKHVCICIEQTVSACLQVSPYLFAYMCVSVCACILNEHVWIQLESILCSQTPLRSRGVDWTCQIKTVYKTTWLPCSRLPERARVTKSVSRSCLQRPEQDYWSDTVAKYINESVLLVGDQRSNSPYVFQSLKVFKNGYFGSYFSWVC